MRCDRTPAREASPLLRSRCQDVLKLKRGEDVEIPMYDFSTHTRRKETELIRSHKIILVEGILIFTHPQLRDIIDVKIYVDTADDVR
jgi:uridine kinase